MACSVSLGMLILFASQRIDRGACRLRQGAVASAPGWPIVWRNRPCVNAYLIPPPTLLDKKTALPRPEGPQVCRWGTPRMGQRLQNAIEILHLCG